MPEAATGATMNPPPGAAGGDAQALASRLALRLADVRAQTLALAAPLSEADAQAQSMPDASPAKWHLAHVTWFFETFVLERFEPGFRPHHPAYRVIFNSYYQGVGEQGVRAQRGLLTRPSLAEVRGWRAAVEERLLRLLHANALPPPALALVELGLHHEQQHQELLLTDLLHLFSCNPLAPVYQPAPQALARAAAEPPAAPGWLELEGGLVEIGHAGAGFAFDNETPRHRQWLAPYALAARPVSQGEWLQFVQAGGYEQPRWWLSAGWDWVRTQRIAAPLHWRRVDGPWQQFSLHGLMPLLPAAPVAHLSLYEADAYARWRGEQEGLALRLPTEAEWEHAATRGGDAVTAAALAGAHLADRACWLPLPAPGGGEQPSTMPQQLFGSVWEWTSSSYAAYPGFRAWEGAVGEYNAKFMANQYVLRGGSLATPPGHLRASYRNFFPAEARWQFTGLRLARSL